MTIGPFVLKYLMAKTGGKILTLDIEYDFLEKKEGEVSDLSKGYRPK